MRPIHWLPFSSALILLVTGCATNSGNNPDGTGPFDAQGNYHEEWANDPSKWNKPGKHQKQAQTASNDDVLPLIASNEQPPPDANPLAPQGSSMPKTSSRQVTSAPRDTARHTAESSTKTAQRKPTTSTKEKSTQTARVTKPKSSPKTKTPTKGTASSTRHIVKKGDSLWTIAKSHGTTVSAIQKANGLSGTMILDGRSLVIPKKR